MNITKAQIKQALGLGPKEVLVMLLFGLGLLVVINFSLISLHFTRDTILSESDAQASFSSQLQSWFSAPILNTITLIVFWVAIGLLAYAVLYWAYNIFTEARNEVVVEQEYTNRLSNKNGKAWPAIEIGLLAGLVVLAILTLAVFFPLFNSMFITAIFAVPGNLAVAGLNLLGAVLGMFVTLYAFKAIVSLMLILE